MVFFSRGGCFVAAPVRSSFPLFFSFCSNFLEIVRRKAPGEVFGVDVSMLGSDCFVEEEARVGNNI